MSKFTLADLEQRIVDRAQASPELSYTRKLLDEGLAQCAKKFGEEAIEAVLWRLPPRTAITVIGEKPPACTIHLARHAAPHAASTLADVEATARNPHQEVRARGKGRHGPAGRYLAA